MREWLAQSQFMRRLSRFFLALDAAITAWLFEGGRDGREMLEQFVTFMDRFHVAGFRKFLVEVACEGLTLGSAGAVFAVIMAGPAFQITQQKWPRKEDLAVTFLDRYGRVVGKRGILHDDSVPLSQYPANLIDAVLSTEDRRFYHHFGVDVIGTLRAVTVDAAGKKHVQGGSTLTQQLVKNLFLNDQRTLERKVNEAFISVWLEQHLTKRQILKMYLDRMYMGSGTFGVQAAAKFYFGKSVADLTLSECAMLAGLFKAPTKFSPDVNLSAARGRAARVLDNMVAAGYISEGQMHAARLAPATPVERPQVSPPDWYLDWAFSEVQRLANEGKFGKSRVLTVRTALDPALQKVAESSIQDHLRVSGKALHVSEASAIFLKPDGAVRAMVGGRDYGTSQFNRVTSALRQPGSSFKPYVYLTAIETGRLHPNTIIVDGPVCLGDWCPHNFESRYLGPVPAWKALAESINTCAVKVSILIGADLRSNTWNDAKLGRKRIIAMAHRLGITTHLEDTPSLPIGADAIKMIDEATAYTAFANGGKKAPPYAVIEVRDSRGDLIYQHDRDAAPPVQVVSPQNIVQLNYMLQKVVETGTGRKAFLGFTPAAGKTGTTNSYKDAWFNGFTGNFVGLVWYGNDNDSPMRKVVGGLLSASTWHDVMVYAHHGVKLVNFPGAEPVTASGIAAANAASGTATDLASTLGAPVAPPRLSKLSAAALKNLNILIDQVKPRRASWLQHRHARTQQASRQGGHADIIMPGGRITIQ